MNAKREYVYALGFCVVQQRMSVSMLQRVLNWRYGRARAAVNWMAKNKYITPLDYVVPGKVLLSLKQYKLSFGEYLQQRGWSQKQYEKDLLELLQLG